MISVAIDEQSYKAMQSTLKRLRQELPRAAVSTMSKSLTKVKNLLIEETYQIMNLTKSRLAEDISTSITGNIDGGNLDDFKMAVKSIGSPVGLIWFASPKDWNWMSPVPIKVKIYRKGQTHTFRHTFLAKGRGASRSKSTGAIKLHMWERESWTDKPYRSNISYRKLPHDYRYPLKRMSTIRIQDVQDKPVFTTVIIQKGSEIVMKDIDMSVTEVLING
jgi:hypothetical protein